MTSVTIAAAELLAEARAAPSGRAARTLVGGSGHALGQTLIAIVSGRELADHDNSGEATVRITQVGRIPKGMLYFPESFREPLRHLLRVTPDPVTGVPYHKLAYVDVQKVG